MVDPKLKSLIQKLMERTENHLIEWDRTADEDTFQTVVADYVVSITRTAEKGGFGLGTRYLLGITNADGELVDRIVANTPASFFGQGLQQDKGDADDCRESLELLHRLAVRSASGADAALEEILKELDNPPF